MKLLLAMVDADRLDAVKQAVTEFGVSGYSVMPVLEGAGESGVHAGRRTHPGSLVALWVVADDGQADDLFDTLVGKRDQAKDRVTRFFVLPVERQG